MNRFITSSSSKKMGEILMDQKANKRNNPVGRSIVKQTGIERDMDMEKRYLATFYELLQGSFHRSKRKKKRIVYGGTANGG